MESLAALVDAWLLDRTTSSRRRISPATEHQYRADLLAWADLLAEQLGRQVPGNDAQGPSDRRLRALAALGAEDLTEANLKVAVRSLADLAPATQRRRLAALSGFCAWLVRQRALDYDPCVDIGVPKGPERLPVGFTPEELARVFRAAEHPETRGTAVWPARDIALVRILAGTGVRNSELCSLTLGALDRAGDPPKVRVLGKGGKARVVPLPANVLARIDAYLNERRRFPELGGVHPKDVLFVKRDGQPLDRFAVDRLLDRILREAGVAHQPQEKAHRFRHTYAKALMESGFSVNEVQALLGHASIATTSIYTKVAASGVEDAARAAPGALLP